MAEISFGVMASKSPTLDHHDVLVDKAKFGLGICGPVYLNLLLVTWRTGTWLVLFGPKFWLYDVYKQKS